MKRNEYLQKVQIAIDGMLSNYGDQHTLANIYIKDKNNELDISHFKRFLQEPFLVNYSSLYKRFYDKNGKEIDFNKFIEEASKKLYNYYLEKGYNHQTKFEEAFPYNEIKKGYFFEVANIIVESIEKLGHPPLFHKSQDKIIRYGWEKED